MANIFNTLRSKFAYIRPGQVIASDETDYVAKPKNSTWIWIEDLEKVRSYMKSQGLSFTPRFRGPRTTVYNVANGKQYFRSENTRKSTCLKDEAKFFVVTHVRGY